MKLKKLSWRDLQAKSKSVADETSLHAKNAWTWGSVLALEISQKISQTDAWKSINEFSSEVSKAMDREFLKGGSGALDVDTGLKVMPGNHRILDGGHDFFSSIERAQEVGDQNGWSSMETFQEWAKAYFTDLSSASGVPAFGKLSDEVYALLRSHLGVDEAAARDFITVNGQEALQAVFAGSVSTLGLYFAWKKEDQDAFSKITGSILFSGVIALNPVLLAVAVVALGIGFQRLVEPKAIARGAFITGASFFVSAIIPGPVLLGVLPAIVVGYYLNHKMGKDFDISMFLRDNLSYIRSAEFRSKISGAIAEAQTSLSRRHTASG